MSRKMIGELLVESGHITNQELNHALNLQDENYNHHKLGSVLIKLNLIDEDTLIKFLGKQLGKQSINIKKADILDDIAHLIPRKIAERYNVLPIAIKRDGDNIKLIIASSNPSNLELIDELSFITGYSTEAVYAREEDLKGAIQYHYYPHK